MAQFCLVSGRNIFWPNCYGLYFCYFPGSLSVLSPKTICFLSSVKQLIYSLFWAVDALDFFIASVITEYAGSKL